MIDMRDGLTPGFIQRILFVIAAIGLSLIVWQLTTLWLLVFGTVVVAVILRVVAGPLIRLTPCPESLAVFLALVLIWAVLAGVLYLFGASIAGEVQRLMTDLPLAWSNLQLWFDTTPYAALIDTQLHALGEQAAGLSALIPDIAGNVASVFGNVLFVMIGGLFLAMKPVAYRDGLVSLFAPQWREKVRHALNASGEALRLWFFGQFISMVLVGTLTGLGLWMVGVPSALALGLIAGLAQFVPIVGPVAAAAPGLILAAAHGGPTFLWSLLIYAGVSQLEANLITPMLQNRIASVPIIITLFAVMGLALLLGPLGIVFAMPLTVVMHALFRQLYPWQAETKAAEQKPDPARDSGGAIG